MKRRHWRSSGGSFGIGFCACWIAIAKASSALYGSSPASISQASTPTL
ncbi:MAG TPA: hypothetical protein PLF73_02030 [Luteimonas sp.]|nr:hypothetical protein [Luteimonas sp.]